MIATADPRPSSGTHVPVPAQQPPPARKGASLSSTVLKALQEMDHKDPNPLKLPPVPPDPVPEKSSPTHRADVDPKKAEALKRTSNRALYDQFFGDERWVNRARMFARVVLVGVGVAVVGVFVNMGFEVFKAIRSLSEAREEQKRLWEREAESPELRRLDR